MSPANNIGIRINEATLLGEIFEALEEENANALYPLLTVIVDIDAIHPELHIGIIHAAAAIPCNKFAREVFRNLVKWKVEVNSTTGEGYTALDIAVANGRLQTTKFLLKHGADPSDRTLALAREFDNVQCAALIKESLAKLRGGDETDILVNDLKKLGLNPGPITVATKPLYLRFRDRHTLKGDRVPRDSNTKLFSPELEFVLSKEKPPDLQSTLDKYNILHEKLAQFFLAKSTAQLKICFTYLLLDSEITRNLPKRETLMKSNELFRTFLNAVFYIGKGTNARPYAHLHEAKVALEKSLRPKNEKTRKILSLWKKGNGVICLSAFRNVSSDEALSCEAAMISAIGLKYLTNEIDSKFPREINWTGKDKCRLGAVLLYRCFKIHLIEGERPLLHSEIS